MRAETQTRTKRRIQPQELQAHVAPLMGRKDIRASPGGQAHFGSHAVWAYTRRTHGLASGLLHNRRAHANHHPSTGMTQAQRNIPGSLPQALHPDKQHRQTIQLRGSQLTGRNPDALPPPQVPGRNTQLLPGIANRCNAVRRTMPNPMAILSRIPPTVSRPVRHVRRRPHEPTTPRPAAHRQSIRRRRSNAPGCKYRKPCHLRPPRTTHGPAQLRSLPQPTTLPKQVGADPPHPQHGLQALEQGRPQHQLYEKQVVKTTTIKSLGVLVDHRLSFRSQAATALAAARRSTGLFSKVSRNRGVSPVAPHQLALSLTLPAILYGSEIWWTGAVHILSQITPMYNMMARPITGLPKWTPLRLGYPETGLPHWTSCMPGTRGNTVDDYHWRKTTTHARSCSLPTWPPPRGTKPMAPDSNA